MKNFVHEQSKIRDPLPTHLTLGIKVDRQIETVYVWNRATYIRPPPTHPWGLKVENGNCACLQQSNMFWTSKMSCLQVNTVFYGIKVYLNDG